MRNGASRPLSIAVVGGSIGGLTAACLLRDDGHDVTVFERSPARLEQRGAGIGLLEETARYLVDRHGESIDDISVVTRHVRYLGRDDTVKAEYRHFYRFSSWNAIYGRMLAHWDPDRYLLDHKMVGFNNSGGLEPTSVTTTFANGSTVETDLLVCADGTGSTARAMIAPDVRFSYSGYVAWRGIVPESEFAAAAKARLFDAINYYVYANSHILVYPIPGPTGSVEPGERLINFVWYRNYLEGPEFDELMGLSGDTSFDDRAPKLSIPPGGVAEHHVAEVKAHAAARLPALLADVVDRVVEPFVQVVYDVDVNRMVDGRACLIGDAAAVARPHAAAGTAKAADDAWSLAETLRGVGVDADSGGFANVQAALARWEPERLELGQALMNRTRTVGARSQIQNTWCSDDADIIFGLMPSPEGMTRLDVPVAPWSSDSVVQ